jgi:class 3 adenylate cyclase
MYYVLSTGEKGELITIEDLEKGTSFAPNPTSAEYKEMLEWIQTNMDPPLNLNVPFPDDTMIFISRHAIAEYCRRRGFLLYATPAGSIPYWKDIDHAGVRLCYLPVAYSRSQFGDNADSNSGIIPHHTNLAVTESDWSRLNLDLKDEDSTLRRLSSYPVSRTFVYLDVSDFSKYRAGEQALIINSLGAIVSNSVLWTGAAKAVYTRFKAMLCIGDGYIFVFDEPVRAVFFASYLAHLIEILIANNELPVEFHFRMGAHVGLVYSFWDRGRDNWNYVGDGINGGNRVLGAIGKDQDDVIFVSSDVRKAIQAAKSDSFDLRLLLACLTNRGRKADKHGNPWRVYEMNHAQLWANDMPEKSWKQILH